MVEPSLIIGVAIVVINLLPILFRKYKLLVVTGAISVLLAMLLLTVVA